MFFLASLRGNPYICNIIYNLKQKSLCGFLVNVVVSSILKTGVGTYAILVVIAFVHHV
jgi:hypothetical protein